MTNSLAIVCLASWYHCASPAGCASWNWPIGTHLRVTEAHNRLSVDVTVVERGPAHRLVKQGVLVDLSKEAFARLDGLEFGRANVIVERIK